MALEQFRIVSPNNTFADLTFSQMKNLLPMRIQLSRDENYSQNVDNKKYKICKKCPTPTKVVEQINKPNF